LKNWKIDAAWYNEKIVPAKAVWETAWAAWQNPNTRTKLITFNKNEARTFYTPPLSMLIGILKSSPFITAAELAEMGIATDKGGSGHNPVPSHYPDYSLIVRATAIVGAKNFSPLRVTIN
jgi:hypothetical protein